MNANTSLMTRPFAEVAPLSEREVAAFLQEQKNRDDLASRQEIQHVISRAPFRGTAEIQMRFRGINPVVMAESFLRATYAHIKELGVGYSVDSAPSEEGRNAITDLVVKNQRSGLHDHAGRLQRDYDKLQGLRWLFGEMQERNLLGLDSILPISDLPETFFAEPVWFAKEPAAYSKSESSQVPSNRHYFERLMPQEFAKTFFVFNPNLRLLREFSTLAEPVPTSIMEVMEVGELVFDRVAITTPYHDLATQIWESPHKFFRSLDPEVFGFIDGLPWFFRVGRWSGDGFLAHKCVQIAVTARTVHMCKEEIRKFIHSLLHETSFGPLHSDDVLSRKKFIFEDGVVPVTNRYSFRPISLTEYQRSPLRKLGSFLSGDGWE